MDPQKKRGSRSRDMGLLIRRLLVFALPVVTIVGFITLNIVMGMLAEKPQKKEEAPKAPPVVAVTAEKADVRLTVTTQGEALPRTEINLASYISGRIADISPNFIEGGAFKKGDVLLSIEDNEFKFRVTQARAAVAQARSRFAMEKAESEAAKREFEELNVGEGSELTLRKPQLAEAAAMLASAEASLGEAELQLARTKVVAPFDGRIAEQRVDIGEFISPGATLGRIFATNVMEIRLPLTDSELGQLGLSIGFRETAAQQGPSVTLSSIIAGEPRQWSGRVVRTDSGFDRSTRTLFAYAEVVDPYGAGADQGAPLAAGLFVTAEIAGRIINDAVVTPRAAIRGASQVYVVRDDNTLEIRDVTLAKSDRDRAIIMAGLNAGERVVTSPVRGAANGMNITVAGDASQDETKIAEREE